MEITSTSKPISDTEKKSIEDQLYDIFIKYLEYKLLS